MATKELKIKVTVKPGKPGEPGKSVGLQEVVDAVLPLIPKPEPGKDADEAAIISQVLEKIPKPKDGEPGKPGIAPTLEEVVRAVLGVIRMPEDGRPGEPGRNGSPDTPEQIIEKIVGKIEYKHIKDAPEFKRQGNNKAFLRELEDVSILKPNEGDVLTFTKGKWVSAAPSGGTSAATWYTEAITGMINGSNKTFSIAHAPTAPNSLQVYLGHQPQIEGVDYTLSGATITYVTAPDASLSGDHYAKYQ